ncbi:MAG TPA: histidine kinase, partial [Ferruginibacter sp.]|nr:histidine kinase [Ferruginibacter sp.]
MFDQSKGGVLVLLLVFVSMLVIFVVFIVTLIYRYQKKQIAYFKEIEELKITHQNTLLQSQLEVQEQTFQHIAREIHDNIGQKLTLAKLYLNTLTYTSMDEVKSSVLDSLSLITDSIDSLSDVSRSMGTEVLLNNGLVKGIELELGKLQKSGLYQCDFKVNGQEIFLNANTEIVIFRIVQECINNFLKHANGTCESIQLHYTTDELELVIKDNGQGFETNSTPNGSGLI